MARSIKFSDDTFLDASGVSVGTKNLLQSLLPIKGVIPANSNLNNLDIGIWSSGDYSNRSSLVNYPSNASLGTLIVLPSFSNDSGFKHQIFINSYDNQILYFRYLRYDSTWMEWKYLIPQ